MGLQLNKFTDSPSRLQGRPTPRRKDADAATLLADRPRPRVDGLYIHVPFCFHKCLYCDFYSIVDSHDRQAAFVRRLIDEMHAWARLGPSPLRTIFIGGGTPTLLPVDRWANLLAALAEAFDLAALEEFTVEANPETVTGDLLATLTGGGVNRLSLGAQSFNPAHLRTLERRHAPDRVAKAVVLSRAAGIANVNLDLIYAIPNQTLSEWRDDLDTALAMGPTHLSCYALTYEPHTPLTIKAERGEVRRADENLEAAMFELTLDHLTEAGFEHYEVSNFARRCDLKSSISNHPSHRCRHNLLYWRNANWLALGPGASGHLNGLRWKNAARLDDYLASAGGAPLADVEQLDERASIGEQLMMRLRLVDGVALGWIHESLDRERLETVERLVEQGLLERTATALRLTRRGLIVADAVVGELL